MMQTPVTREPEQAVAAGDGEIGVERYAEVLAHIVYFKVPSRPEILQRLGIDPSAWAAAEAKWMQALVDEALEDERPVGAAFGAAFAPVHTRLKAEKPSIDSIGTPPAPSPPPEEEAQAAVPVLPPAPPPPVAEPPAPPVAMELPTYLMPSRPPVPPRSPLAATSLSLDLPIGVALPFAKGADDTLSQPPPKPPSPSSAADDPVAAPTALPPVRKAPAELTGTSNMLNLPIGPALPFAKSTAAEPPAPSPPPPPSPSSAGDSASAAPALPRVQKAPPGLTGTVTATNLPVAAVLPFAQGAAGEPPPLTLEAYAALRANLAVKGEEDAATWKQFGIASQAMKEALQARFAARFRDDAGARDRFVALLQRMVSDLRAKPGT